MRKIFAVLIFIISAFSIKAKPLILTGNISAGSTINSPCILQNFFADQNIFPQAILLTSEDGTAAYIKDDAFHLIYIDSLATGWNAGSDSLPPVSNIKNLSQIVIWQGIWNVSLAIETEDNNPVVYQPFFWNLRNYEIVAKSEKNGYSVNKYRHKPALFPVENGKNIQVIYHSGDFDEVEFDPEKFSFDGYHFFYNQKQIQKIIIKS